MSDPIKLYNKDGSTVLMYSPKVTEELVAAGKLFLSPPVVTASSVDVETVNKMMRALDEEE